MLWSVAGTVSGRDRDPAPDRERFIRYGGDRRVYLRSRGRRIELQGGLYVAAAASSGHLVWAIDRIWSVPWRDNGLGETPET